MVVKLVITPACHAGGRGFESRPSRHLQRPWTIVRGRFSLWTLCLLAACLAGPVLAKQPSKRPADDVRGETLYQRSCWMCHGEQAAGDGPAAASLPGGVPDLRGQLPQERWDEVLDRIMNGTGSMPAFAEEMNRRDARRILVYLEKLEEEPEEPEEAEEAEGDEPQEPPGKTDPR